MSLTELRRNYTLDTLNETDLTPNPLNLFDDWLKQVIDGGIPDPNAMTLATVASTGMPSQRLVLLKGRPDDRFVFYTNYGSHKAYEISQNNQVSLHFPWYLMERQVMVLGKAYRLSSEENDDYFSSRPKSSQIAAASSNQSKPVDSKASLMNVFQTLSEKYEDKAVPRPANWGGYYVVPSIIEFWQGGEHRMHDRFRYVRINDTEWQATRLQP